MEKDLTIEQILELAFTTPNPETGSLPPEKIAWVIFENETVCLIPYKAPFTQETTFEQLADFAIQELQDLGEAIAGTPSADFSVSRVPWFSESYVFMITYESRTIFNIGIYQEDTSDILVGMLGRATRNEDVLGLKVHFIRDFEGKTSIL